MKILKIIGAVLAILVGLFVIVGLFLPSTYEVTRTVSIDAPAPVVFEQVNDLTRMEAWSPWGENDPSLKTTYGEVTVGTGATSSWTSEQSGTGSMTILESVPNESVRVALDFGDMGTAESFWKLEETDSGVNTTWGFSGDAGWDIPARYIGLAMDSMVGPDYERGLQNLKKVAEAAPAQPEPAAPEPEPADDDVAPAPAGPTEG